MDKGKGRLGEGLPSYFETCRFYTTPATPKNAPYLVEKSDYNKTGLRISLDHRKVTAHPSPKVPVWLHVCWNIMYKH